MAQTVESLPVVRGTWVGSLSWDDPLQKEVASPLQYSCLENPMDRGAWQATVPCGLKELDTIEQLHFAI